MKNQANANHGEVSIQDIRANQNTGRFPSHMRTALSLALAVTALASGSEALACAACGCTLSTDWGSQGVSTKPGFSVDLAYSSINQNQQRYGTSKASAALINSQNAAGQEIEAFTKTQIVTASLNYTGKTLVAAYKSPTWIVRTALTVTALPQLAPATPLLPIMA